MSRDSVHRSLGLAGLALRAIALSLGLLGTLGAAAASAATMTGNAQNPIFTAFAGQTNNLRVTQLANGVTKWDDDHPIATFALGCVVVAGDATCTPPGGSVSNLTITLGDGNDTTAFTTVLATVLQNGDDGDDTLGAPSRAMTANGGPGADNLRAADGVNRHSELNGNDGNDTLTGSPVPVHSTYMRGGAGSDTFAGGAGYDSLLYTGAAAVTVTPDDGANDGAAGENDNVGSSIEEVNGGDGDDTIVGNAADNDISGGKGNDTLTGGGGDDTVSGDAGNDTVSGSAGDDIVSGDAGDDALDGASGDDRLYGGGGADDWRGGDGIDSANVFANAPGNVSLDIAVTPDDVANDGAAGEGDNVRSDIEDIVTDDGNDTITGNAAVQVISGAGGNDSIDGGAGNDILSGNAGDDTLRARDGFADRVSCGEGTDSAIVDTLDTVSDGCESVDRVNVGNATDTPDDRPPTVAFSSPAEGGSLPGAPLTVTIAAGDDKAVARVLLLDDGRTVGSDSTAPYQISYSPAAADIGRNTLVAIAVDSAEQTASAVRPITIGRFAARSLSLKVKPPRDRAAPYSYAASGSVRLPAGVSRSQGCGAGSVRVQARRGGRVVGRRTGPLRRDCGYSVKVRVRGKGKLAFTASFSGNAVFLARTSRSLTGRAG